MGLCFFFARFAALREENLFGSDLSGLGKGP